MIGLRPEECFRRIISGLAVFGDTATYGCGECGFQLLSSVVVLRVARRARLLAPRFFDPTGIDRIEAEFVHQAQRLCTRFDRIAGDRKCNAVWRAFRATIFEKAPEEDVVECLDDGAADLLGDPRALRLSLLDRRDATVTSWVVVAGVDDDNIGRHSGKQIAWQVWHRPLGNGDDHNLAATRSLECRHGRRRKTPFKWSCDGLCIQRFADVVQWIRHAKVRPLNVTGLLTPFSLPQRTSQGRETAGCRPPAVNAGRKSDSSAD